MKHVSARVRRRARRKFPGDAHRTLLEHAEGALGKGLEREIGARDEAVVEQRRHNDVDEHEHPDVAGAGGFAEGDKIVPAAIEEAVRVDRLVARAARTAIAIVDADLAARLDDVTQRIENDGADLLPRARPERETFRFG